MKKLLGMVLAAILVLVLAVPALAAGDDGTVTVSTVKGKKGDEVTLDVKMTSTKGILGFQFDVTVDEKLELVSVEKGDLVGTYSITDNRVAWFDMSPLTPEDAVLVRVTVKVLSLAEGQKAEVSIDPSEGGFVDPDEAPLDVTVKAGGVNYPAAPTTEAPTTEAPTTEAPTTVAPTTAAPTTAAPTTAAPTTAAPTTAAPTTVAPTTVGKATIPNVIGSDIPFGSGLIANLGMKWEWPQGIPESMDYIITKVEPAVGEVVSKDTVVKLYYTKAVPQTTAAPTAAPATEAPSTPATGDAANVALWISLFLSSGGAAVIMGRKRK